MNLTLLSQRPTEHPRWSNVQVMQHKTHDTLKKCVFYLCRKHYITSGPYSEVQMNEGHTHFGPHFITANALTHSKAVSFFVHTATIFNNTEMIIPWRKLIIIHITTKRPTNASTHLRDDGGGGVGDDDDDVEQGKNQFNPRNPFHMSYIHCQSHIPPTGRRQTEV